MVQGNRQTRDLHASQGGVVVYAPSHFVEFLTSPPTVSVVYAPSHFLEFAPGLRPHEGTYGAGQSPNSRPSRQPGGVVVYAPSHFVEFASGLPPPEQRHHPCPRLRVSASPCLRVSASPSAQSIHLYHIRRAFASPPGGKNLARSRATPPQAAQGPTFTSGAPAQPPAGVSLAARPKSECGRPGTSLGSRLPRRASSPSTFPYPLFRPGALASPGPARLPQSGRTPPRAVACQPWAGVECGGAQAP